MSKGPYRSLSLFSSSDRMGPKLLELLGVHAHNCRSAVIKLEAGHPVTVTAEYYASAAESPKVDELKTEVREFLLVERGQWRDND